MFNARKSAQVIAYLALKVGNRSLAVIKAIKLVYLADRSSIAKWGMPILDEQRVSMPHGPVNSLTYSHINGEHDLVGCGWSDFLENRANNVVAAKENVSVNDLDELSDADIECLDLIWNKFGHMDKWEIRDWTHDRNNIPEWEDPDGSSVPIPLVRIMSFVGVENADAQAELLNDHLRMDALFKTLS